MGDGSARARGAKIIHVDPRFTRTSAMADMWAPIRAGSDVAFLGGLIHYVLENEKDFREYVRELHECFRTFARRLPGYRGSGRRVFRLGSETKKNTKPIRGLTMARLKRKRWSEQGASQWRARQGSRRRKNQTRTSIEQDLTLQHPRCVYQVLKRHFSRYTPEMVEKGLRHPTRRVSEDRGNLLLPHPGRRKPRQSVMRWAGRNIPTACKSFVPRRFCNCCWAILAGPAAGFSRFADMLPFKARPTFRRFTTFCLAICPCRSSMRILTLEKLRGAPHKPRQAGGAISTSTL